MEVSYGKGQWFSKDPFITLRKKPSADSFSVSTVTCTATLKEKGVTKKASKWVLVKSGASSGYVKKSSLTKKKGLCLSQREKLIFNSLSLTAEDIYFWAKLNEHFIFGEVNESY